MPSFTIAALWYLLLVVPLAFSQDRNREYHVFRGTVVDPEGKPIAGATVGSRMVVLDWSSFSEPARANMKAVTPTNDTGDFTLSASSPCVLVRKIGYRSYRIKASDRMPVTIVMQPIPKQNIPACESRSCPTMAFPGGLCLGKPEGLKVIGPTSDIDYTMQSLAFRTPAGWRGIRHGVGGMWSFGVPTGPETCSSSDFEETAYEADGFPVVDARGKAPDGTLWRYLGMFGDSADYGKVDEKTAKILNRVLDRTCIMPPKTR